MSSIAQEESRSISENVKWGIRKSFQDGKVKVPFKNFLGYKKDENGNIVIDEEAKIVRRIYSLFLNGFPIGKIADILNSENILTPSKKTTWRYSVIDSILRNEKYKGSALLQKYYSVNFLTKEMKENNGEIPKYYIEESHPPIIDKLEWGKVQTEIKQRDENKIKLNKSSIFASKIFCEECGSVYGQKVWHSNDKYRRVIYRCNNKYNNSHKCSTPHITESRIKELFIELVNKIFVNKDVILNDLELVKTTLEVNDNNEITLLESKLKEIENTFKNNLANKLNNMNEYDALIKEYESVEVKLNKLIKDKEKRNATLNNISKLISDIKSLDTLPIEFDEVLFYRLVDKILITNDDKVIFITKDNNKYIFNL